MQGNERWPPTNPSARLRSARVMPQWVTARGTALPPPPPPPDDPLPPEPEYEVIEFPGQQTYSNQPVIRNKERKRCDLCGSSAPAVKCMQCPQQNFCYSCDDMYHRHPKRQSHVRRELDTGGGGRPPLPPKGEPPPPPVPPPRRNKRSTPRPPPQPPAHIPPPSPHLLQRESASPKPGIVGSLKKMIGVGHAPGVSQTLDRQHSLPPHSSMMGFHEQQIMNCNGFPEWQEIQRGHRSGSFSALNQPAFGHMLQAQSMAHLNCPSCHGHGMWTPWGGMPQTGTWQSSNFLNRGPPKEDWSDSDSDTALQRERLRRFSTMSARAPKNYMIDDTHSVRGGRRTDVETSSHKGGRRRDLDTLSNHGGGKHDFDTMSSRGGRRKDFETMSNRGGKKQDFDTMSLRGGRKSDLESSTVRSHRKYIEDKPSRKLVEDRFRNDTPESESSYERESEDDFKSTRRGRKVMSDLEDIQRGRRHSQPAPPLEKTKNNPKNKRNERFSDTGRRRSSPINYKYESPSEEENDLAVENREEEHNKVENGVEPAPDDPEEEEEELGPIPDCEWECAHCTFVNEGGTRVCAVCCKTSSKPKLIKEQDTPTKSSQPISKNPQPSPSKSSQPIPSKISQPSPIKSSQNTQVKGQQNSSLKLEDDFKKNLNIEEKGAKEDSSLKTDKSEKMKEKRGTQSPERTRLLTSKGTSPPPQSISTQTYEEAGRKLKRATSLADYGDWKAPQRSASRQSLLSDTQSLPVTPPRSQSPEQFRNTITRRPSDLFSQRSLKRAGSQPPEYISTLVQKQVKQGLEMVKLLREAEDHQFSAEDLAVALLHCGDGDPIVWLQENWRNMIDTVVTLGTNYGQERKENTIGTISASEAREALRSNDGNVWAAVTECVEQRQRKYGELLARGNFSREDIVTALTATHGNVEEAFKELNKNQLKPFLMRIWGPPQGADNDDGDFTKLAHGDLVGRGGKNIEEREVRRLLAEGLVKTYEQAEIAVQLKDLNLEDDITLAAANECHSLEAAIAFLQQECQLCAGKYTMKEMVSMLECEHRCCLECANNYFSVQITERSINDCVCPFCKEPDILHIEEDKVLTYFSHLDIFLKGIVKENIHELFQRKLRDRTLMQDPNFKWCIKCSSGFIANPRQKRFMCPDCKAITCAKCMKPWEKEHEKMSCEEYKKWLHQNDPEHQLEKHLDENGVTCPKCRTKYLLAKGGCMHLTCPQCKYEFCSGCSKPFLMGRKCTVSEYCEKLGLHSHHPRNCLFYLRDKEPEELERLLEDHKIEFRRGNDNDPKRCGVQLLKETADGFVEAICGHATVKAGLCKTHYVESLVLRIRMNNVDPVKLLDFGEAMQELRRNGKELPERPAGMSEFNYRQILYKVIEEEIPLE